MSATNASPRNAQSAHRLAAAPTVLPRRRRPLLSDRSSRNVPTLRFSSTGGGSPGTSHCACHSIPLPQASGHPLPHRRAPHAPSGNTIGRPDATPPALARRATAPSATDVRTSTTTSVQVLRAARTPPMRLVHVFILSRKSRHKCHGRAVFVARLPVPPTRVATPGGATLLAPRLLFPTTEPLSPEPPVGCRSKECYSCPTK